MPKKLSEIELLTKKYAEAQEELNAQQHKVNQLRSQIEEYLLDNSAEDGEGRKKEVTKYAEALLSYRTTTKLKESAVEALKSLGIDSLVTLQEVVNEELLITLIKNGKIPKSVIEASIDAKTTKVLRINVKKYEDS
jgi:antitoxin component of RelBE/YafQ-DinJ toxin-antitoxin module